MRTATPRVILFVVLTLAALAASPAWARTLNAGQVLVVYDSRIPDSLAVAEFYAGSAAVPGGAGGEPGARPGVRVVDLATIAPQTVANTGTMTVANYKAQLRDPLRAYLTGQGLEHTVRCLVLTKGLPHRLDDPFNPGVSDDPATLGQLWTSGQARAASVDAELTLIWHNLDEIFVDPFRTVVVGYVINPYWRESRPIGTYTTANILEDKNWAYAQAGRSWTTSGADIAGRLTPGDIMLVCRLDGHTVQDVRDMVTRAQGIVLDVENSTFIIDESQSDGIANPSRNTELDNVADPATDVDDYETTRDVLLADGRFEASRVLYNGGNGQQNFYVGPNVDFGGQGVVVSDPVVLLTHYGRNHFGRLSTNQVRYEESFNLAPGAVFNTMESFNGRAFNGLGTRFDQAQVADFIASGGTFGIGMVWEPLAQSVPDSNRIVRSFFLGRLTWAEAAYTAIPTLSWMHVVIGDPLATVIASSEDINGDGVLDGDDLSAFAASPVDLDRDGTINDVDRLMLQSVIQTPMQETHDAERDRRGALRQSE